MLLYLGNGIIYHGLLILSFLLYLLLLIMLIYIKNRF